MSRCAGCSGGRECRCTGGYDYPEDDRGLSRIPESSQRSPLSIMALARALCLSSHHGMAHSRWPCAYHMKRAAATLNLLKRWGDT